MGPSLGINSMAQCTTGPKQSSRKWLLQMYWANPWTSAAYYRASMGPSEAAGMSFCKCNGPILGHRQHGLVHYWAQAKLSETAAINVLGQSLDIGSMS